MTDWIEGRVGSHAVTKGWWGDNGEEYIGEVRKTATAHAVRLTRQTTIATNEGEMVAEPGDVLMEGPAGECWPTKAAIFAATYEPLSTPERTENPHG